MPFHFNEYQIPADMTDGDAIDILRLTGKASGLRSHIARRRRDGRSTRLASVTLERVKADLRTLTTRYA